MGYNGINFDRARMPARQGIIDPSRMGPPQVAVPGGSMRQAIVQQAMAPQQSGPQSVAEILSQSPGDLGGATNAADRQRQIADMLMQGANSRQATDLVTGFSKLGEAFIARGAGKKADAAEAKRDEITSLLTQQAMQGDEASIAALIGPKDAIGRMDVNARNAVVDEFTRTQLGQGQQGIDLQRNTFGETVKQNEFGNKLALDQFGLESELGRGGLGVAQFNAQTSRMGANNDAAAASATPAVDFGDVKGVRETNEKRFQTFEESQRAYQSMSGLAELGTGAADIALGFAFFKTFDPNSTVREGEFAQAAGAMGLGDRAVSIFARLDKGEQFTPQLRKELVEAAGVAYQNQVADIEGLVQRESEFASRYGINPSDITRNPVRALARDPAATAQADVPPPPADYDESDVPWADAWAEMTPAERALFAPQSKTFPSRITF